MMLKLGVNVPAGRFGVSAWTEPLETISDNKMM